MIYMLTKKCNSRYRHLNKQKSLKIYISSTQLDINLKSFSLNCKTTLGFSVRRNACALYMSTADHRLKTSCSTLKLYCYSRSRIQTIIVSWQENCVSMSSLYWYLARMRYNQVWRNEMSKMLRIFRQKSEYSFRPEHSTIYNLHG